MWERGKKRDWDTQEIAALACAHMNEPLVLVVFEDAPHRFSALLYPLNDSNMPYIQGYIMPLLDHWIIRLCYHIAAETHWRNHEPELQNRNSPSNGKEYSSMTTDVPQPQIMSLAPSHCCLVTLSINPTQCFLVLTFLHPSRPNPLCHHITVQLCLFSQSHRSFMSYAFTWRL